VAARSPPGNVGFKNNQIYFISKILVEHSTVQPHEHLQCPKQTAQLYAHCPILTLVLKLIGYPDDLAFSIEGRLLEHHSAWTWQFS
jgi:hypothetical protein